MRFAGLSRLVSTFATFGAVSAIGLVGAGCGGGGSSGSGRAAAGATANTIMHMPSGRAEHSATLLQTGEVLVAGGVDLSGDPVATTVIVGATSVRSGPDLAAPRVGHTATLLSSGQVIIAGGSSDAAGAIVLDTSEVFDPVTSTFSAGPALTQARTRHVAMSYVRAQGEFVLFAGGASGLNQATPPAPVLLGSAEVLNVTAGTSSAIAAQLAAPQASARAARLDTGGVLIVGGEAAQGQAPAQVFDPATRTFSTSNVVVSRAGAAVASRGREVLVAGGQSATGLEDSTEIFDSATRTFAQGVRLGAARRDAAIATVGTSDVVIVGGRGAQGVTGAVEKLTGLTLGQAQVATIQPLTSAREDHTATGIDATRFVVVGGYDAQGVVLATVELIDLAAPPPAQATTPAPTGTTTGTLPGMGSVPVGTTPGTGTTNPGSTAGTGSGSGSSGSGGLFGGLFGGGSSSGSGGGSVGSTLLNAALQSAVQALTSTSGTGGGFSGFLNAFLQNFMQNALPGLFGGAGSSGTSGGSGLSGILSSLLGSLTGSSGTSGTSGGSGLSGILSSLLGSLTGSSSGGSSSSGLGGLLSGLFGGSGSSGSSSGSSGGGLAGLLSGLFGGGSSSGSTASGTTAAPTISGMTPGSGPVGTQVTITGANFGTQVTVAFGGVAAQIQNVVNSGGQSVAYVTVPSVAAGAQPVTLTTNGQTVSVGTFTVQ